MPSMFKGPPKVKPAPPPVPLADEKKTRRARRASASKSARAGGRGSTLLSDEKLGGG
jgi:hypothetical protein